MIRSILGETGPDGGQFNYIVSDFLAVIEHCLEAQVSDFGWRFHFERLSVVLAFLGLNSLVFQGLHFCE